jgi:CO/xanthine dehydrogenase Mo-binding subunit
LSLPKTLEQARDAAELIEVAYAPRPHTVGTYESAQPGAPLVHDHIPEQHRLRLGDGRPGSHRGRLCKKADQGREARRSSTSGWS